MDLTTLTEVKTEHYTGDKKEVAQEIRDLAETEAGREYGSGEWRIVDQPTAEDIRTLRLDLGRLCRQTNRSLIVKTNGQPVKTRLAFRVIPKIIKQKKEEAKK